MSGARLTSQARPSRSAPPAPRGSGCSCIAGRLPGPRSARPGPPGTAPPLVLKAPRPGLQGEAPKAGVGRRGRTTSLYQGEATRPDQVWSWDFVMLRTRKGRALRVLFIIDEFTKRIVARFMATAIRQQDVVRVLLEATICEKIKGSGRCSCMADAKSESFWLF